MMSNHQFAVEQCLSELNGQIWKAVPGVGLGPVWTRVTLCFGAALQTLLSTSRLLFLSDLKKMRHDQLRPRYCITIPPFLITGGRTHF
eukprot:1709189-Amphidinium_carterae.1